MNKRTWIVAAVVSLAGLSSVVAIAATAPDGPYKASCTKISMNGKSDTLYATCKRADQTTKETSLWLAKCKAKVYNCNGNLTCGPCP